MNFFDLVNISEKYMELVNPMTPEKILKIGRYLDLKEGSRIIEFGCGYGEILLLWSQICKISAIGIDIREAVCERAKKKILKKGLSDNIEIVCTSGSEYEFEKGTFDVAANIGATFIWGGFRNTVKAMKEAIHEKGKLIIGEPYWITEKVPAEYKNKYNDFHTEYELLKIAREEGFDFQYMVRSSHDDWDTYEASNWYGLTRWLDENPDHPERQDVIDRLHKIQDEYFKYGREYLGWAIYILKPV